MTLAEKHDQLEKAVEEYEGRSGHSAQHYRAALPEAPFKFKVDAFSLDVKWYEEHSGHVHQRAHRAVSHFRNLF